MEMTINNRPMVGREVGNVTKITNLLHSGESVLVCAHEFDYMFINQQSKNEMLVSCLESPGFTQEDINCNIIEFFVGDLTIQSISIIESIEMNLKTREMK